MAACGERDIQTNGSRHEQVNMSQVMFVLDQTIVRPGHEWVNLSQGDCDWGILGETRA